MLAAVRQAGAAVVSDLLSLPASSKDRDSLIAQFAAATKAPMALSDAFDAFKGTDGKISFKSVHSGGANFAFSDGSVRTIRNSIVDHIWLAMELGVYGERVETLPGVALADMDGKAPGTQEPVGFGMLRSLTMSFFSDLSAERAQLDLLAQAEAAAQRGDATAMKDALSKYVASTKSFSELPRPLSARSAGYWRVGLLDVPVFEQLGLNTV
jgi:prepilin-type processing-associated H-X9-DG protein